MEHPWKFRYKNFAFYFSCVYFFPKCVYGSATQLLLTIILVLFISGYYILVLRVVGYFFEKIRIRSLSLNFFLDAVPQLFL